MGNSELGLKESNSHRDDEYDELLQTLPKERIAKLNYYFHQGFWVRDVVFKGVLSTQKHFVALDDDILLASFPKSGTTWLKALSFSIVNRHRFPLSTSPLLTSNPHALVPNLEYDVYDKSEAINALNNIPKPRLLCTHIPYASLPISIKNSNCKIVYICRNPMDQFVSFCHFIVKIFGEEKESVAITEESLDQFCRGVHSFGPIWDHVLQFWKASLETPRKIFFMKYEDLKDDGLFQVKQLAEFLGFPFSEEEQGLVEEIIKFCSIDHMKGLKVNINGKRPSGAPNSSFFRKGEVGDWVNHITPIMAQRVKKLMQEKYEGSGLEMF